MIDASTAMQAPAAAPTLRDELKAGTAPEHRDLERTLNLLRPDFSLDDYRRLLARYHGFYVPFESFLHAGVSRHSVAAQFYCRDRLKLPLLEQDLHALGVDLASCDGSLPDERIASLFSTEERIVGAIYVIEGSMLGGAILSKHFMKRLRIAPETGLCFFNGYGHAAKEKWLATLRFLHNRDRQNLSHADVVDGARRMFRLLKQHLVDESAS